MRQSNHKRVLALLREMTAAPDEVRAECELGFVYFMFRESTVAIFDDAGDLDYVEWVKFPDGTKIEFEELLARNGISDPLDVLSDAKRKVLDNLFAAAVRL